jgi:hypothetical protein
LQRTSGSIDDDVNFTDFTHPTNKQSKCWKTPALKLAVSNWQRGVQTFQRGLQGFKFIRGYVISETELGVDVHIFNHRCSKSVIGL